jgi:lipoate-protein ligase A
MTNTYDYEPATWRLLDSGTTGGAANMAIDEAIVEAVADGRAPATLRFYAWEPACLSLGYAQPAAEIDRARLAERGWDLVRRPTGGRAILHADELTYAIIAPESEERVQGGVIESYDRLSLGLVEGLQLLGLQPKRAQPVYGDRGAAGPACFDGPGRYEITFSGFKLVGSAQMRRHGVVLQHGTLPLYGDITRIAEALVFAGAGERRALQARLHFRATTLHRSLGRRVEYAEAAQALQQGFARALQLDFAPGALTPAEQAAADRLRAEKYATEEWTAKC